MIVPYYRSYAQRRPGPKKAKTTIGLLWNEIANDLEMVDPPSGLGAGHGLERVALRADLGKRAVLAVPAFDAEIQMLRGVTVYFALFRGFSLVVDPLSHRRYAYAATYGAEGPLEDVDPPRGPGRTTS